MKKQTEKTLGMYEKGMMWGRDGYWISIGIEDALFFFGNLRTAKSASCAKKFIRPADVKWVEYKKHD